MPNHGKGGRKPEGEEVKRAQIPVRTTPAIKARLEAAAKQEKRSLTQEIEARLEASLDMDDTAPSAQTHKLLAAVARDIARAEELTGRPWHYDEVTWAMVREAMASGEIERQCPAPWMTDLDDTITEQFQRICALELMQNHDAETLVGLGFPPVEIDPLHEAVIDHPRIDFAKLRQTVDESTAPEAVKAIAKKVFIARMEEADRERIELRRDSREAWQSLRDAIEEGVNRWNADLAARGIAQAREYRPSASIAPPRNTVPTPKFASTKGISAILGGAMLRESIGASGGAREGNNDALTTADNAG